MPETPNPKSSDTLPLILYSDQPYMVVTGQSVLAHGWTAV